MQVTSLLLLLSAIVTGLARIRRLSSFFRIFIYALITGFLTTPISDYLHYTRKWANTGIVDNMFVILETGLLLYAASLALKSPAARLAIVAAGFVIAAIWVAESYQHTIYSFNTYSYLAECIMLLTAYVTVMYHEVLRSALTFRNAVFWLSLGVIINAGCNIPFFCLFRYLTHYNIPVARKLYLIVGLVSDIQYVCCIIAFAVYKPALPIIRRQKWETIKPSSWQ